MIALSLLCAGLLLSAPQPLDRAGLDSLRVANRADWLALPTLSPTGSNLTSPYGTRVHPVSGVTKPHYGIDLAARRLQAILAAGQGVVAGVARTPQYGNVVDLDHGNGYITRYAHNERVLVRVGQVVRRGERIALAGRSGTATGVHCHFEVFRDGWSVDPCETLHYVDDAQRKAMSLCGAMR